MEIAAYHYIMPCLRRLEHPSPEPSRKMGSPQAVSLHLARDHVPANRR